MLLCVSCSVGVTISKRKEEAPNMGASLFSMLSARVVKPNDQSHQPNGDGANADEKKCIHH